MEHSQQIPNPPEPEQIDFFLVSLYLVARLPRHESAAAERRRGKVINRFFFTIKKYFALFA